MSESYEAIIFRSADAQPVELFRHHAGAQFTARLVHLGGATFGIYRVAPTAPLDVDAIETVAASVSTSVGVSLSVFYDNQCGVRCSSLFKNGERSASFGETDELWVPLDDSGQPRTDQPPTSAPDWNSGEEYERVRDGIDAGLEAAGMADQVTRSALVDGFCYGRSAVLAEAG